MSEHNTYKICILSIYDNIKIQSGSNHHSYQLIASNLYIYNTITYIIKLWLSEKNINKWQKKLIGRISNWSDFLHIKN